MIKTIKKEKKIKNKTRRNNKREFIKEILKEWKTQTDGCYEKDNNIVHSKQIKINLFADPKN
jgi:hypothetical protein